MHPPIPPPKSATAPPLILNLKHHGKNSARAQANAFMLLTKPNPCNFQEQILQSETLTQAADRKGLSTNHHFSVAASGASPASRDRVGQNLNQGRKGFRRNPKAFSGRNHKFSAQKQVISKKKKAFAKIRRLFLAEIASFNVFSAEKHQLLPPKKIPWGGKKKIGGEKTKIGGALPPPLATRLRCFHD